MSTEMDISEEIDRIVSSAMNTSTDEFDDDTSFGPEGLDADSLSVVEMAEMVDIELGVEVPDEDLLDLETVGDIKSYVRSKCE